LASGLFSRISMPADDWGLGSPWPAGLRRGGPAL